MKDFLPLARLFCPLSSLFETQAAARFLQRGIHPLQLDPSTQVTNKQWQ